MSSPPPPPSPADPDAPRTPRTVYLRSSWLERSLVVLVLGAIAVGLLQLHAEAGLAAEHAQTRRLICDAMTNLGYVLRSCP